MDSADSSQGIKSFSEEHSDQSAQLKLEIKHLQKENETLLSQKLQDKVFIRKLLEDIKLLAEKCTNKENEYWEEVSGCKLERQTGETSLLDQIHEAQQQRKDAEEICKDLKLKLQKTEKENDLKEIRLRDSITRLTKEKDQFFDLSMEKGTQIREKHEEIQQMERDLKEENKARVEAEDRFQREAEAINANVKGKSLQAALDESLRKHGILKMEFEAFKEHTSKLLKQERELNKKLRHVMG
ncbi:coiled-coil domain-containing protein 89 [Brachionichthys hirsutus]|uniref:coiled-coil domain-containing protein 89 n=1 Tax=Brachionichthys hirsutus TaxID=412623 RepID=UPI0036047FB9